MNEREKLVARAAEADRQRTEAHRQWDQADRQWAEARRQWAEAHRQWDEAHRQRVEAHRQWAEADRTRDEAHRQWAEADRTRDEAHRQRVEAHRTRDEAHRQWAEASNALSVFDDNRTGPLPTLDEAIGMIPKSDSATSAPEHENKGVHMTKSDRQAADYRAEERERAAPSGLRTERVTLEIVHDGENGDPADWPFDAVLVVQGWIGDGESVRVVPEAEIDAERDGLRMECKTLTEENLKMRRNLEAAELAKAASLAFQQQAVNERDAAIRERDDAARNRDRLHGELGEVRQQLATAIRELEELREQLESVACRAATAETAMEAESGESDSEDADIGYALRLFVDGRRVMWHELDRQQAAAFVICADRLAKYIRDEHKPSVDESAPAASGVGEPTYAPIAVEGFPVRTMPDIDPQKALQDVALTKQQREAVVIATSVLASIRHCGEQVYGDTIKVLRSIKFDSPPRQRGWLTPEEQDAILLLIGSRSQFSPQTPHEARRNEACRVCHLLLDRSTPPEVVLPQEWGNVGRDVVVVKSEVIAALAAAGVAVKEVGSE